MKTVALLATFSLLLSTGCNSNLYGMNSNINSIPKTYENPLSIPDRSDDQPEQNQDELPIESDEAPTLATTPPPPVKDSKTSTPAPSDFIKNAERIMITEGKKIGTPCNFYLRRVLEVSGFPSKPFLANDFDNYATKNFSNYTAIDFKNDRSGSERSRLKKVIWSYPQRTPFIFQWSRSGFYGHVAIVERIGDDLIVYQASIGSHSARRDRTSVDILLNGFNRRLLTMYINFTK